MRLRLGMRMRMMRGRWKGVWEWQELDRLIRCGFEARSDAGWCGNVLRP